MKRIAQYEVHLNRNLGEGGFGVVYEGMNTITGERVAIKCINKNIIGKDEYQINALKNQIRILLGIKSPYVVAFKNIINTARNYYLIQELCDGDLCKYLKQHPKLSEAQAIEIFSQFLKGFYQLIVIGVVHRDLKPENILYKGDTFKIADFGLAKRRSKCSLLKTTVGTINYQSPQVILGDNYTSKCDIWALGAILYELVYGRKFIACSDDINKIKADFVLQFPSEPQVSDQCKKLLRRCLKFSEEERAGWEEVFQSPLFKEKNLPSLKALRQHLSYILTKIRHQIQQDNIDLEIFFEKFKKSIHKDQINIKQFSQMVLCLAPQLHKEDIKYIFWNFDANSDGKLCLQEFQKALKEHSLYYSVKPTELNKDQIQEEGMMTEKQKQHLQKSKKMEAVYQKFIESALSQKIECLHEKFYEYDKQDKGLCKAPFTKLCIELCPKISQQECDILFQKFDENKDGTISYGQFYKYLCKVIGLTAVSIIKK